MIVTVTLDTALDVTYEVDAPIPRPARGVASSRVARTQERAGGKGVNVSRVLAALGYETLITGLAGGPTGQRVRADLHAAGLCEQLHPIAAETPRTVTTVSRAAGNATVFNEAVPVVTSAEWSAFTCHFAQLVQDADVVVLAGNLPPGLFTDAYAELTFLAHTAGATVVLDTCGDALRDALSAGPDVVTSDAAELVELTGRLDVPSATARMHFLGARAVVARQEARGLYVSTSHSAWQAVPPAHLRGNLTGVGVGDAYVAAIAVGLTTGALWPEMLREAMAISTAAVAAPAAGAFDIDTYLRLRNTATVGELHAVCH
jgi:tagatose 6-phosphate kinase